MIRTSSASSPVPLHAASGGLGDKAAAGRPADRQPRSPTARPIRRRSGPKISSASPWRTSTIWKTTIARKCCGRPSSGWPPWNSPRSAAGNASARRLAGQLAGTGHAPPGRQPLEPVGRYAREARRVEARPDAGDPARRSSQAADGREPGSGPLSRPTTATCSWKRSGSATQRVRSGPAAARPTNCDVARKLFDWTVRNIQTDYDESRPRAASAVGDLVPGARHGLGAGLDIHLARCGSGESTRPCWPCRTAPPRPQRASGKEPLKPWCVGVLIGDKEKKLYLFDSTAGPADSRAGRGRRGQVGPVGRSARHARPGRGRSRSCSSGLP